MNSMEKSLTAKIPLASREEFLRSTAEESSAPSFAWSPHFDRKTLVVAAGALGVGMIVGGTGVFLYRRWNDKLNQQVEVLSKSVEDVYNELRSLQQGMVQVQDSLTQIRVEPGEDQAARRRRPRRLQFYESDSEDSSVYFSAAEEDKQKRHKPILRRHHLPNGHTNGYPENGLNRLVDANGFSPVNGHLAYPGAPSLVLSPSDEESETYEDALQENLFDLDDNLQSGLTFEKEFERRDHDGIESVTPFDSMDVMLDSAVTNEQVIAALEVVKSQKDLFPDSSEYLWRLAKATFVYANQCIKKDPPARTVLLKEAKDYADKARKLNHSNPDVLKWSALTTGGLARYADTTQKINFGLLTREFLQSALELRPNDPSLHHILGRWNFEISQLGWIERTAVRAIFGKYSHVNVEDAKNCFLEAERLKPRMFKSNMYYIAKCYAQQGNKTEARKWLEDAFDVKRLCVEDELCDTDIQELLAQL